MATYTLEKMRHLWNQEELTDEQMLGQRSAELTPKPAPTSGTADRASAGAAEGRAGVATGTEGLALQHSRANVGHTGQGSPNLSGVGG